MREAMLWEGLEDNEVRCDLCRHRCRIKAGRRGVCGVRENRDGRLFTLVYDRVAAEGVDPIEKKPFFHFLPGTLAYSIATMGCNFHCLHCQNSGLSRTPADTGTIQGYPRSPEEIVEAARARGCRSISYTYSEPTVFAELALDTAEKARAAGLKNTFVTNGYQSPELLRAMEGLVDAANVDLKSFSREFYHRVCGADLEGVLDTLRRLHASGVWIEVTTLLIPGMNDGAEELKELARFIADLSPDIPWHVSRYHPAYKMHGPPPTPRETLDAARRIGREAGIKYVFSGNVPGDPGEHTYCHACGAVLIERWGFAVRALRLREGACPECGTPAAVRLD